MGPEADCKLKPPKQNPDIEHVGRSKCRQSRAATRRTAAAHRPAEARNPTATTEVGKEAAGSRSAATGFGCEQNRDRSSCGRVERAEEKKKRGPRLQQHCVQSVNMKGALSVETGGLARTRFKSN